MHELEHRKVLLENWFQQLKVCMTRWRVPQNIRRNLPANSHIQLELNHTSVWYMQGEASNAKSLDYYLTVDQIFRELSRQTKTKIPVLEAAKQVEFSIEVPLTDQEKEEYYELNLCISTFVSEDIPFEPTGWVHITIKPPTTQRANPQPMEPQPQP